MDFLPQIEKEGTYDWVVEASDLINDIIKPLIQSKDKDNDADNKQDDVVVLGAGTSTLSEELLKMIDDDDDDDTNGVVISLDIDDGCVQHMIERVKQNPMHNRLHYYQCDLTKENSVLDLSFFTAPHAFDLVLDKGTFDAILVEGSTWEYLVNAHSLLKFGGYLIICSLHSQDLLEKILNLNELNLKCSYHTIQRNQGKDSNMQGCVAMCQHRSKDKLILSSNVSSLANENACKKNEMKMNINIDVVALAQQEKEVLDDYYQKQNPLINAEEERKIRIAFDKQQEAAAKNNDLETGSEKEEIIGDHFFHLNGYMSYVEAYNLLFHTPLGHTSDNKTNIEGSQHIAGLDLGYTLELFLEDLECWQTQRKQGPIIHAGYLSADELIGFLKENQ